jgi:acetyltransferase
MGDRSRSISSRRRGAEGGLRPFDGGIRVRPLRPTDGPALVRLGERCAPEDLRLRFFHSIGWADPRLIERLTQLDPAYDAAFAAFEPGARTPLGVARLHGDRSGDAAEFAVLVRSDRKGRGHGEALMRLIIEEARRRGYRSIHGQVLTENDRMIALCRRLGFRLAATPEGVIEASLALAQPLAA